MRILIVEDDSTSRRLLQGFLEPCGECDIAVNGQEGIEVFRLAWDEDRPCDLICLDIKMPVMGGMEMLKKIRKMEEDMGIFGLAGVKIIMTTVSRDSKDITEAFKEQCEAYIIKPIDKKKLFKEMASLGLIE